MLLLAVCLGNPSFSHALENGRVFWIGLDELGTVLRTKSPVIIDLRTPREYAQGCLPGAVNVPIEDLYSRRSWLDEHKDKNILLYCRTVNKTSRAIRIMQRWGFRSLFALQGGYEAYKLAPQSTVIEVAPEKKANGHTVR